VFDGLKARLERLLRERGGADPRAYAAGLREALVEARFGIAEMRRALATAEVELQSERKQLADAERRGKLAAAVPDPETVAAGDDRAVADGIHRQRRLVGLHRRGLARSGGSRRDARSGRRRSHRRRARPAEP
jgi:hypothetical protein